MIQHLPQVLHLVGRAARQIGAAGVQHDLPAARLDRAHMGAAGRLVVAAAQIVQRQLQGFGRDGAGGSLIQRDEQRQRGFRIALGAVDAERALAAADGHRNHGFDGAQVFIHRAAQMAQAGVVQRGESVSQQHGVRGCEARIVRCP